jgi:eukaryotic-like serine/threonine-protein kinase
MNPALKLLLKHLAAFLIITAVLITVVMMCLKAYTRHNDVIVVPDLLTLTPDQAAVFLEKKGLRYKVVDSMYVRTKLRGSILEQRPKAGAHVKSNRFIFLTINARTSELVNLPDVKDFSQRQAVATLEGMEIRVAGIDYVPSEFRDLVLDVRYNGRSIATGYKLPKGSSVVLTVGQGSETGELITPDLLGMTLAETIDATHAQSLNLGDVQYDVTPKDAEEAKLYRVYRQEPVAGMPVSMGKKITLWMTTDEETIQSASEEESGGVYIE